MDLSIIIVNWRSKDYLRKCLVSIAQFPPTCTYETIVIDAASFDGSAEMLKLEFPTLTFIQSSENLGFSGSNNLAFSRSHGHTVLFLNPDTEVRSGAVQLLVSTLESDPTIGIVGPRLLNSDGSVQDSCIQSFPTIANQLLDSNLLRRFFPGARLWGNAAINQHVTADVDAISGACLMIRRDLFERLGGFSTDYFMYSEDTDISYCSRRIGMRNVYVPEACVVHHGGASSSQSRISDFAAVMLRESCYRFFRKFRGRGYALAFRLLTAPVAAVRLLLAALLTLMPSSARTHYRAVRNRWSAIFLWAIGLRAASSN